MKTIFLVFASFLCMAIPVSAQLTDPLLLWHANDTTSKDTHVAFRGLFDVSADGKYNLHLSGASWYVVWLDGKYFYEGPDRYSAQHPEYQEKTMELARGSHVLAIEVHNEGIETRILDAIHPFLFCQVVNEEKIIPVTWKCLLLDGFEHTGFRINAELGWIEWADTRKIPADWQDIHFDDAGWKAPVAVERTLGKFTESKIGNVKALEISPRLIAQGKLAEVYGYEKDNPSARFFLRDLVCDKLPAQGVWRRYDLGRVRLSRPKFVLDLPAGAVVEFAYSEFLNHGRVAPWITLSTSDSYNFDHFVARGGRQEFFPLHPKGGRFAEIHILAPGGDITFVEEKFIDRTYNDLPAGEFQSNDVLLNKIWMTGIETYRACSEDALIDNPTRERGQWIGDMGVGMRIGAAGFSDLRICRRGLVQSAQCARVDGMVAGLCPGGEGYLSSFSAQWVSNCVNYYRLTGDKSLLEELYPAAENNIAAFQHYLTRDGISYDAGWAFIDWGYVPNPEPSDMGLNLHYYIALQNMVKWSQMINRKDRIAEYEKLEAQIFTIIQKWFLKNTENGRYQWDKIGYHRIVLGMLAGFIPRDQQKEAVAFVEKHILNCFPNNPDAPRLSDPGANNPQLITPYFSYFAFQVLIEQGEMEFVLNQYRKCWGWALEDDRTTWLEVFDTRWSGSHQWAGSPTWQLSTYVLGLQHRYDLGKNIFDLAVYSGDLKAASGKIPLPDGGIVQVMWEKTGNTVEYEITTPEPITVNIPKEMHASKKGAVVVKDKLAFSFPIQ